MYRKKSISLQEFTDLNNNVLLKWSCQSPGLIKVKNYEIKYQNQPGPGKGVLSLAQFQNRSVSGALNMLVWVNLFK